MKGILKKGIATILCCMISVSAVYSCSACKSKSDNGQNGVVDTDISFVDNKSSRYKILIPDNALDKELFAAQELQYFTEAATGYELDVVTQDELSVSDSYLSIGQTEQMKERGIEANHDELGDSGYRIVSDDAHNVYLFGADNGVGEGTIYSIYGFLKEMFDYTYYSDTTIYYKKTDSLTIKDFNLTKVPRFQIRYVNTMKTWNDPTYKYRMGWSSIENRSEKIGGHAFFDVLDPDIYYAEHKDWYYYNETKGKPTQLCLSNTEMRKEYSKKMVEYVKSDPEKVYFNLGIEDNADYCDCENCCAAMEKYGTYGGLYIDFCNSVTEEADAWVAKHQPDRNVQYVCYIYYATEKAPVVQQEDGTYAAIHVDVIPKKNLELVIASIDTRIRNKALDDEVNINVYETYKKWSSISENIQSYNYAASYYEHAYMYAINDFINVERDMEIYEDCNVAYLYYTFGYRVTDSACLYDMKAYCISQLMWGTEKSYQELARDFMEHSYLDAADAMWDFYEDYRLHMVASEEGFPSKNTGSTFRAFSSKLLPKSFVDKLCTHIEHAYQSIEKYRTEDPALYKQLVSKINKEEIMPLYIYLQLYQSSFSLEQRADMISRLAEYSYKHNIIFSGETHTMKGYLDTWTQNLK